MKQRQDVCERCGFDTTLEPHYLLGTDRDGQDEVEATEYLCKHCHQERHTDLNGDVWKDVREMDSHWYGYFKETEDDAGLKCFT
jgi:hypothetical protein